MASLRQNAKAVLAARGAAHGARNTVGAIYDEMSR